MVSDAACAIGPMSSAAGAEACVAGLPARLLPTGAANAPPTLVDDNESPSLTGPGVTAGVVVGGGGVSGGGVGGGGVSGGGWFIATRRAGRIFTGSGLGGSGLGGSGGTGLGFTVSTI